MERDDADYDLGRTLFDNFVRGDAMIGLIADVPGTEREMLDALWAAAGRGSTRAFRLLGDSYLASLKPIGAFEGVDPGDAATRPWSPEAKAIVDEANLPLEAALRAYFEAARLGDREATAQLAKLSRHSSRANQKRALAQLEAIEDPSPAEEYQRGLVQNWLGDYTESAKTHARAAERGDADAQFELYIYYAQGTGVTTDLATSAAWLERAALLDHPRALYNVGAEWASGKRGEPDMKKAASFYSRAAERGNTRAAATLGVMILGGEIEGTKDEAIGWLNRADEGGYPSWEMLDAAGLDDPRDNDGPPT